MISKIIQKEKERQKLFLTMKMTPITTINCHKQSLINLKEYISSNSWRVMGQFIIDLEEYSERTGKGIQSFETPLWAEMKQYEEDIKELTKMIERYE